MCTIAHSLTHIICYLYLIWQRNTVLPLTYTQDLHVIGEGKNLVVLLKSTIKPTLLVGAATVTNSITVLYSR